LTADAVVLFMGCILSFAALAAGEGDVAPVVRSVAELRYMIVGRRPFDGAEWTLHRTRERVGWDSHNYIAFGFDREGQLHLCANMHCVRLRYYRTETAGDPTSLKPVHRMTGQEERRCTYPRFLTASGSSTSTTRRRGPGGATWTSRCSRAAAR